MKAYPFGIPSVANIAVTASTAATASFLDAPVVTASLALNLLGPQGPSGSNVTVTGAVGPKGAKGATGPKGLGVYLLSSSLATCLDPCTPGCVAAPYCSGDNAVCLSQDGTYTEYGTCTQYVTTIDFCQAGCCSGGSCIC